MFAQQQISEEKPVSPTISDDESKIGKNVYLSRTMWAELDQIVDVENAKPTRQTKVNPSSVIRDLLRYAVDDYWRENTVAGFKRPPLTADAIAAVTGTPANPRKAKKKQKG